MIFHTSRKKVYSLQLEIADVKIERVQDFNFLGLTLNDNLNWKSHINNISNTISKSLGILNKLKHFLHLNIKILLYNFLILSHLNFGILALGYKCEKLTKLQKRVIRIIYLSKYNAHIEPIFKELKLLKLNDTLKLQELKFYYKFKNIKLPHYLQNLPISSAANTHDYATRTKHNIRFMKTDHEHAKHCIHVNLPKFINSTPSEILDKIYTHSLQGFAGYIKLKCIKSYRETCSIVNCYCYICSRQSTIFLDVFI